VDGWMLTIVDGISAGIPFKILLKLLQRQGKQAKMSYWDFIKIKRVFTAKETVDKTKKTIYRMGEDICMIYPISLPFKCQEISHENLE